MRMAYKSREDMVGKRFLAVYNTSCKLKLSKIAEWEWRAGIVRSVSTKDQNSGNLSYFQALVDRPHLSSSKKRIVEFLGERDLAFVIDDQLQFYREGDESYHESTICTSEMQKKVRAWVEHQDSQKILLTTPVVLIGARLEVYRVQGTTQWYTAFIHTVNETSKSLVITDDTVLEHHHEDPALVQMRIIDSGLIRSILRGDTAPRRAARHLTASVKVKHPETWVHSHHTISKASSHCGINNRDIIPITTQLYPVSSTYNDQGVSSTGTSTVIGSRINCVVSITSSNRDKRQRWRSKESTGDICEVKAGTGLRNRDCCSWPCSSPEGIANHKLLEVARRAGSDRSLLPVVCCSPTVTNVQRLQDSGRHSEFIHPIHECKGDLSVENASLIRLKLKKFSIDDSKTSDKCNLSISDQFKGQHRCVSNETHNVIDSVLCTPVCKSYGSVSIDNATASTDQVLPGNDVLCHKNSELDQSVTLSRSNERRVDKFVPVFNNDHDVHVGKRSSIKSPIQSRWPATVIDSAKVVEETLVVDHVLSSNSVEIAESMHFKKQLLFAGGTTSCSFSETHPPDSVLSTGIDVNRSVTDQLTRLAKAEGIVIDRYEGKTTPDGHIDTCAASMSTNGLASLSQAQCTSISHGFTMDKRRDKGACMYGQGFHQPSPFTHHNEGRTHSCSSDSSKLSANLTDERSFASRLDNVVSIVKSSSSASTSPLILGGSEPISIYRDPELMSKNPVQSNLCASQHKSISGISFPHASHLITTQPSCYIPFSSKASKVIPGIVTHALPMMPYEANTIAAGSQLENHLQHQLTVLHPHYQQFPLQYPVHANVRHLASHVDLVYQQKLQNASVPQSSWIVGGRHDGLLPERLGHEEQLSMYERLKDDHRHSMNLNESEKTFARQDAHRKTDQDCSEPDRERVIVKEQTKQRYAHLGNVQKDASAQAAVDEHFVESFRLAKLKEADNLCLTDDSKTEMQPAHHVQQPISVRKSDVRSAHTLSPPSSLASTMSCSVHAAPGKMKSETIFSLYGYPYQHHSTITTEQLQKKGLVPTVRDGGKEKTHHFPGVSVCQEGVKKLCSGNVFTGYFHTSVPSVNNTHNSVIVENKMKLDHKPLDDTHSPSVVLTTVCASSFHRTLPHGPLQYVSQMPCTSTAATVSSTQPILVTSQGRFFHQPNNQTVFSVLHAKSVASINPTGAISSSLAASGKGFHPGNIQAVNFSSQAYIDKPHSLSSLPLHSAPLSHSAIQQRLMPNLVSTQGMSSSYPDMICRYGGDHKPDFLCHTGCFSKSSNSSTVVKRRSSLDTGNAALKKAKIEHAAMGIANLTNAPVTCSCMMHSPFIVPTSQSISCRTASEKTMAESISLINTTDEHSPASCFMDSFKSFVENTVQKAYSLDTEVSDPLSCQVMQGIRSQAASDLRQTQCVAVSQGNTLMKVALLSDSSSLATAVVCAKSVTSVCTCAGELYASPVSLSPAGSGVYCGTDNDVNPQSHVYLSHSEREISSPHLRAQPTATKLKKAWLQRHADDEKPFAFLHTQCPLNAKRECNSTTMAPGTELVVATCVDSTQVNSLADCARASSGSLSVFNGSSILDCRNIVSNDDSTASETETMQCEMASRKKRSVSRKPEEQKRMKTVSNGQSVAQLQDIGSLSVPKRGRGRNVVKKELHEGDFLQQETEAANIAVMPLSLGQFTDMKSTSLKQLQCAESSSAVCSPDVGHDLKCVKVGLRSDSPVIDSASPLDSSDVVPVHSRTDVGPGACSKDKKRVKRGKHALCKNAGQATPFNKPLVKCSVATLKRTGTSFVQDGPCSEITPKLSKCRECKLTPTQRVKKIPNIFCRFYAFRRLKYNAKATVSISGFCQLSDADPDDIKPWLPRFPTDGPALDAEMAKFILSKVGDKFCELVEQEKEARMQVKGWKEFSGSDSSIAWKRAVTGVREMCDVCDTTLFNMHWVCHKCGFVICLDCYKVKEKGNKGDVNQWLTCSSNRMAHEAKKLMLTQIIPSDALWELGRLVHEVRRQWAIPAMCLCKQNVVDNKLSSTMRNGMIPVAAAGGAVNGGITSGCAQWSKQPATNLAQGEGVNSVDDCRSQDRLAFLASVALDDSGEKPVIDGDDVLTKDRGGECRGTKAKRSACSTLRELLTKTAGKGKAAVAESCKPKMKSASTLDDIIQAVVERNCREFDPTNSVFKFMHYIPRLGQWNPELPVIARTLNETSVLYPDVPHSWLCDGRLLRLHHPSHKGNLRIFQEQWKRGQPVLVSCVDKLIDGELWSPGWFNKEFGMYKNDLVNCRSGSVIVGNPMCHFWEGFESLDHRLLDEDDKPMLLKLKDWPPGDDFAELLPVHFRDLMQALPLPEYTQRSGKLNLASRLPDFLVRPDLGPKMYNAYGSASFPKDSTTNLHLDVSDATNVLVYVGVPSDSKALRQQHELAAVKAIDDAGCDSITKCRVREVHELPGALWQVYNAYDADKIRDFLNKVAKERGEKIESDHDPIHDQSWYLDEELRDRLYREYSVHGYTIVQCLGDAIFIPAGAPHQVRNLHSCVKVAEDFVSPEHLNHCFRLTQEFRQLSDAHSNHEDKLQVKNIIYHAVKDAIAVLRHSTHDG